MIKRLRGLLCKLLSPDAPAKIARRLRMVLIARSIIRPNPLFAKFSRQSRIRRLSYGTGHTAIVFGAGGHIGEAIAGRLLKQGCQVIGTYRTRLPQLSDCERLQIFPLDITSVDQVDDLYLRLERLGTRVHLIVVATGVNSGQDYHATIATEGITRETLEREGDEILKSFQSNTLGPYFLMRRYAGLLCQFPNQRYVPQICLLSSSLGTMNNELYGGMYGYRTSKGALHALAMAMYCDLNLSTRVGVQILGPGNVATPMNPSGVMTPDQAATEIVSNLEYSARKSTFQFLGVRGRRILW